MNTWAFRNDSLVAAPLGRGRLQKSALQDYYVREDRRLDVARSGSVEVSRWIAIQCRLPNSMIGMEMTGFRLAR